jgi:transcriptional regulator with XRE-family HTH domain
VPALDPQLARQPAAFGDAVRRLRAERGWTQERLAHETGFDRKSINRIENAAYSPSLDRLLHLAHALGVAPTDLLAGVKAVRAPRKPVRSEPRPEKPRGKPAARA